MISEDRLIPVLSASLSTKRRAPCMSANLCTKSHMRELLKDAIEVADLRDATTAAMLPKDDDYLAALINFRYMANAIWSTEEAVANIKAAAS